MIYAGQVWGINTRNGQRSVLVVGVDRDAVYFRYHDLETMEWEWSTVHLSYKMFRRRAWFLRLDVAWAKSNRSKEKGL